MPDEIIKSYQELCDEIEIWKSRVRAYQAEIRALNQLASIYGPSDISGIDYSKPRVKKTSNIGFEEYLLRLYQIEAHIKVYEATIEMMKQSKEDIEKKIEAMSGVDKKVVYLRDIKGMTLKDIADQLGYSHQYIKEISARNKPTEYIPTKPK